MFTGIVQSLGMVHEIKRLAKQLLLKIRPRSILEDVQLGESIAVNGCCLTVTQFSTEWFEAYVSAETFTSTNLKNLSIKDLVNLERAMKLNDKFGGHIVTGHVDEVAVVRSIQAAGESKIIAITVSPKSGKFLVEKGSVALDGISLTIIECGERYLKVNVIPETFKNSIAKFWQPGYQINFEVDPLAKFAGQPGSLRNGSITKEFLAEHGFT